MASRRLKHPLDPAANAAANRTFWANHPDLKGQRLSPDSDVHLRREWVDNYLAAGGALETEPNTPPAAVAAPCAEPPFDCQDAWSKCESEADAIINKSSDPVQRNKNFNAAYARMYLEDPKLEWLGAAS